MMSSLKTYLSFVLLFAFVLSSHVLTHELLDENINDEKVDPLEDLKSDSSIGYKPNGQWGITIGPEPNDEEFDDEEFSSGGSSGGHGYGRYGGGRGNYNNYGRGGRGRRGGRGPGPSWGDDDYDEQSGDYDYNNRRQNRYNRRRYEGYSVESVHPQSSSLQNSEMMTKNYDLDENKMKHRKMIRPSKSDYWSSTTHEDGVKKGYEEVGKKPMN